MELPGRCGDWLRHLHLTAQGFTLRVDTTSEEWGLSRGHHRGPPPGHQWGLSHGHGHRDFRAALTLVPGIEPSEWTLRELRHSFVSVLSASGVSVEQIADLVGHRGTRTTELVYRHQLKPVLQTGATVMDTLFAMPEAQASNDA